MWERLLVAMLRRITPEGNVVVHIAGGEGIRTGNGTGPLVTVRIADRTTARRLLTDPELAFGESYMDGCLTVDGDDIQGLLAIIARNTAMRNRVTLPGRMLARLRRLRRGFDQDNQRGRSRRNVAHHYDLPPALYDLFLDADRQYSCAYFRDPGVSLEEAQRAKKAHIAAKLMIAPGMRVLDIGCGWGGMALTLARDYGAQVTGITLSEEQLAIARARAEKAGLAGQVTFSLTDYRDVEGPFDRIVSVGMFEHVGLPHFGTYFAKLRDLLTPDGVALIHTIGRTAPPQATNPWIAKYIFPGGYVPSLSEVARAIEGAGLRLGDIECLRLHYAMTLRHWSERFEKAKAAAAAINDERFVRMWRFYLAASEQTFRHGPQDVFQFQLIRRPDAVPITRDYIYGGQEAALRRAAE